MTSVLHVLFGFLMGFLWGYRFLKGSRSYQGLCKVFAAKGVVTGV